MENELLKPGNEAGARQKGLIRAEKPKH